MNIVLPLYLIVNDLIKLIDNLQDIYKYFLNIYKIL